MRNLVQLSANDKVIEALAFIASTYGKRMNANAIRLQTRFTRQEIAEIAGTTQEQVIRTISSLKKQGLIQAKGKDLTLTDVQALSTLLDTYGLHYFEESKAGRCFSGKVA